MLLASLLVVIVLLAVVIKLVKKNNTLSTQVTNLASEVKKPFGLAALESVGGAFGGLTAKIVEIAYVAVAAVGKVNTVAAELADALSTENARIVATSAEIDRLQSQVVRKRTVLAAQTVRATDLGNISALLPKS